MVPRTAYYFAVFFLFISIAAANASDQLKLPSHIESVSSSNGWKRLLHFKKKFPFGNFKSEVTEGNFFLHPMGNKDERGELVETANAFFENRTLKTWRGIEMKARCLFPARWVFLKSELGINFPDPECPALEDYLKKINGKSLTLVFSSSYPNSPPSMFGHTFFKVNSASGNPLLDIGVNYSARAGDDENAVAFALYGVFGGYYGGFAFEPYYMKVNEYNHAESRDLWEYDLNLTPTEVRTLLLHLWELDQNALFRYYFADENCSYRLLTLLEVARPDWTISNFAVHAIPAETVKEVVKLPGAVRAIHFRPSVRRKMAFNFKNLTDLQKKSAFAILDFEEGVENVEDPSVLDAVISYLRYESLRSSGKLGSKKAKLYRESLSHRSRVRTDENISEMTEGDLLPGEGRPEEGHGAYQLSAGVGSSHRAIDSTPFAELGFKFAYHDLLNSDRGYTRFSHVDFPSLRLRAREKKVWIERLGLLSVTSLSPITTLEKNISWNFDSYYGVPKDLGCLDCHTAVLDAQGGVAFDLIGRRLMWNAMGGVRFEGGTTLDGFLRYGPELRSSLLLELPPAVKVILSGTLRSDLWQGYRQKTYVQFQSDLAWNVSQEWDIRAQAVHVSKRVTEGRLALYRHF
jgi:hypothetical protein